MTKHWVLIGVVSGILSALVTTAYDMQGNYNTYVTNLANNVPDPKMLYKGQGSKMYGGLFQGWTFAWLIVLLIVLALWVADAIRSEWVAMVLVALITHMIVAWLLNFFRRAMWNLAYPQYIIEA